MCGRNGCNYQKLSPFSTNQNMPDGGSVKGKLKKFSKGTEKASNNNLKPALNIAIPYI